MLLACARLCACLRRFAPVLDPSNKLAWLEQEFATLLAPDFVVRDFMNVLEDESLGDTEKPSCALCASEETLLNFDSAPRIVRVFDRA